MPWPGLLLIPPLCLSSRGQSGEQPGFRREANDGEGATATRLQRFLYEQQSKVVDRVCVGPEA